MNKNGFVAWLHIGDLHASDEDGWASVDALTRIVSDVGLRVPRGVLDFAFLPGDNANHGEEEQYRRIADALGGLAMPCHAIPGDHDFEPGTLALFNAHLAPAGLPAAVTIDGRRCLFLDVVSGGSGGPDFRLDARQQAWLGGQLALATRRDEPRPVVFMHAFPEDFGDGGDALAALLAEAQVAFVDTGHTHYNEILNDGQVIYSSTRSTGQVEEGPVGFAIAAVDGPTPSWRFKTLASKWPFVLITSPADARLTTSACAVQPSSSIDVHALVLGNGIVSVDAAVDDGPRIAMRRDPDRPGLWVAAVPQRIDGHHRIEVVANDAAGGSASDEVELRIGVADTAQRSLGSHRATIGRWRDRGLLGTRLGPNANGKKW